MNNELIFSIFLQIMSIAFFAGIFYATQKFHREIMERMEVNFATSIAELKEHFVEKIERLERKQDKHNSVIERTYCVEQKVAVIEEQNKVQNHRIEDLERKYEHV